MSIITLYEAIGVSLMVFLYGDTVKIQFENAAGTVYGQEIFAPSEIWSGIGKSL